MLKRCLLAVPMFFVLGTGVAEAYPTSVVFAPTGDAKQFGDVAPLFYSSMSFTPTVAPATNWACIEIGVLPRFEYGHGYYFGGLEIGGNLILSDLLGTGHDYVKPVFDAKLYLLVEKGWVPHISVGIMEVDPFRLSRSLNLTYGAMTKTLEFGKHNFGRLTVGLGGVINDFKTDPYRATFPAFYASKPFSKDSHMAMILGYESPTFGPFAIGIDHIGGVSEVSSTNVALNVFPAEGAIVGLGGWFGSDPNAFAAGMFAYLLVNFNAGKVFAPAKPAPEPEKKAPAAPAPAPATPAPTTPASTTPAPTETPAPATPAPTETPASPTTTTPAAAEKQP